MMNKWMATYPRTLTILLGTLTAIYSGTSPAQENKTDTDVHTFNDWLKKGTLYGEIKSMAFLKTYGGTVEDKKTFALGGNLQYRSANFNGFSFGLGEYTAHSFGWNDTDPERIEKEVPGEDVNVLGKAFIQYENAGFRIKAGRFGLDTPFASSGEGRTMIPSLYQGVGGSYQFPTAKNLELEAYRIYKFKPYGEESFGKGDTGFPVIGEAAIDSVESDGFTTMGLTYSNRGTKAQAWYYDFDRRAQLAFAEFQLPIPALKFGSVTPFFGLQYLKEWDTSNQAAPYENVDTDLYAAKIGIQMPHHIFYVGATVVPSKDDAFRNGAYFSPYSNAIYNTTPLFSGQPTASLVTKVQPGKVYAVRYIYHNGKFKSVLGYTRFDLEEAGMFSGAEKVNAGFAILGYDLTERFNAELELDYVDSPNAFTGDYHTERLRLTYKFGDSPAARAF